ncbi:alpha/beta fold hydrolase [Myxacorys almedinensis]|uniref:Alpha/beta fold hydrolase n=1 Tax=Myxacorys almedinensis A TaxID=2690445 RepID=A0A8J7Z9W6_9CYAN|nr:alpha/beta hydrolase [Myxacorys almedinensis]NDJ19093.1 alpha/beta fold hydrolase [Myxacorys almedinensis A]
MPTITVLGVPHVYEQTAPTSSNEVLIFVHGWLLSRTYWQPLIDRLAPYYQCLSYDLRGFGESQPCRSMALSSHTHHPQAEDAAPTDVLAVQLAQSAPLKEPIAAWQDSSPLAQYSLSSYAKDLGVLLQELNISQAWLVGHSLGGYVALWAADQLPEQVRGVICLNSGGGIYLKESFERFRAAGQHIVKLRPRWLSHVPCLELLFTRTSTGRTIARTWARQRLVDFVVADREAALGTLLDSTTEYEVHRLPQLVARLRQPVYFIAGAKDPVMEPKYVRHLASFHPLFSDSGANVFEIPECGHLSMVECPEIVAERIELLVGNS